MTEQHLSLKQVAARCGVDVRTPLAWIKNGELIAICISRSLDCKKKRYVVRESDLLAFEEHRLTGSVAAARRQPTRRQHRVPNYLASALRNGGGE
jgi:hypothetical protein